MLPRPAKVICCGLNYADHIPEMGRELPEHPTLFAKYADTLIGRRRRHRRRRPRRQASTGRPSWRSSSAPSSANARRAEAAAAIAGYTVANDISVRDWQNRTLQWFQGKAWDAHHAARPGLVTPDEIDPEAGVDGSAAASTARSVQRRQHQHARLRPRPRLLAYISTFTILRPGDVVLTGTPGGVGMGMTPPRFLPDGDVVATEIDGIGTLTNTVRL